MTEIRCKKCNRLMMKVKGKSSHLIEIKCPKCGYLNTLRWDVTIRAGELAGNEECPSFGPLQGESVA